MPERFQAVENWIVRGILLFQGVTRTESAFGDPTIGQDSARIEYSRFNADVRLQRDTASFLAENLLPLLLLTTLLYASLFLPFSSGTPIRVNLAVTSILTSAVLLGNISNRLPDIGYTVAIEYGFYAFFALALACTVIANLGNHWATNGQETKGRYLAVASKVTYPLLVLGVVLAYVTRYG